MKTAVTIARKYFSSIRNNSCCICNQYRNSKEAVISPHPLTNFEIKEYYEKETRFDGVYSRDILPKTIKNGAYVKNLDEHADVGTQWIALYLKKNEVIYFDSFGVEHVPKEIKKFIGHKNIKTNTFRIQADNSIM